jgi:hypothetical protein
MEVTSRRDILEPKSRQAGKAIAAEIAMFENGPLPYY